MSEDQTNIKIELPKADDPAPWIPKARESEWFYNGGRFGGRNFSIELLPAFQFNSFKHDVPIVTSGAKWGKKTHRHFLAHTRWLFWYFDFGFCYAAPKVDLSDGFEERKAQRRQQFERRAPPPEEKK